jgi:hypothetical protein
VPKTRTVFAWVPAFFLMCGPALADSCAKDFGGSCRSETFTMIVKDKGQQTISTTALRVNRSARKTSSSPRKTATSQVKRPAFRVLRRYDTAAKSPSANASAAGIPPIVNDSVLKPNMIVEEGFNAFTSIDFVNDALEQALKTRQQLLTSELQ